MEEKLNNQDAAEALLKAKDTNLPKVGSASTSPPHKHHSKNIYKPEDSKNCNEQCNTLKYEQENETNIDIETNI